MPFLHDDRLWRDIHTVFMKDRPINNVLQRMLSNFEEKCTVLNIKLGYPVENGTIIFRFEKKIIQIIFWVVLSTDLNAIVWDISVMLKHVMLQNISFINGCNSLEKLKDILNLKHFYSYYKRHIILKSLYASPYVNPEMQYYFYVTSIHLHNIWFYGDE